MRPLGKIIVVMISSIILLFCVQGEATTKHKHKNNKNIPVIYGNTGLVAQINRLINHTSPNLNIGIQIKSMRYNDILYSRNYNHFYVPASILKIFTAEAALLYLGQQYKFSTKFVTDAKSISSGVLNGNLYLVHSGDPSLSYSDLLELMDGLKARQIRRVNGNIYIDTSAYDQEIYGPGWISNDTRFCYSAPISASIIDHNCMVLQSSSRKSVTHPLNVIRNIIYYNKSLIQNLFQRYGIQITGAILPGIAKDNFSVVVLHQSKSLQELISEMLKKSDNVIAGSLFKKMGELYTQSPGSWQNGSIAVKQILKQKINVDIAYMNILDGSGLSRKNRISPNQMMQVLDFAYHNNLTSYDFISALPIAGIDGTLKNRMKNIAWKVRAKTGSMTGAGIVALAGYAITKNREPLAFVIIINGRVGFGWRYKDLENKIMTTLTNYSRQ